MATRRKPTKKSEKVELVEDPWGEDDVSLAPMAPKREPTLDPFPSSPVASVPTITALHTLGKVAPHKGTTKAKALVAGVNVKSIEAGCLGPVCGFFVTPLRDNRYFVPCGSVAKVDLA